mmetsp:Transcript_9199/g.17546  ORF Transcript_9199/g.17546 Transcript_9199/m.17546 type:complete len:558 (+) Transcript_9199:50-1723(+)
MSVEEDPDLTQTQAMVDDDVAGPEDTQPDFDPENSIQTQQQGQTEEEDSNLFGSDEEEGNQDTSQITSQEVGPGLTQVEETAGDDDDGGMEGLFGSEDDEEVVAEGAAEGAASTTEGTTKSTTRDTMKDMFGSDDDEKEDALFGSDSGEDANQISSTNPFAEELTESKVLEEKAPFLDHDKPPAPEKKLSQLFVQKTPESLQKTNDIQLIRLPNVIEFNSKEWKDSEFGPGSQPTRRENVPIENVVRWRYTVDSEGKKKQESNARLVKWPDGSSHLYIGKEIFTCTEAPMDATTNLIFAQTPFQITPSGNPEGSMVSKCIGGISKSWQFKPVAGIKSKTHAKLKKAIGEKFVKVPKVKKTVAIIDASKAAKEAQELERKREEERKKMQRKREQEKKKARGGGGRTKMSASFLQSGAGNYEDDDEEEGFTGLRGEEDEDKLLAAKKTATKDASDDEADFIATEDDLDEEEEEIKRKKRSSKKKRKKMDSDDDEEEEEEEEEDDDDLDVDEDAAEDVEKDPANEDEGQSEKSKKKKKKKKKKKDKEKSKKKKKKKNHSD